ncbi:MAG: D-alanyl-D-alanine carboxypeptidase [Chthoniobacterales bacterium]|nr:D-alanyl-D-alanine carboxypeptidase [Chthoniobacterales bacterium]
MKHFFALLALVFVTGCATAPPPEVRRAEPAAPPVASAPSDAPVWPSDAPGLTAESAILIDARNGEVLFQKNADQRRQVASTQKLLTAQLVARRGNLGAPVAIAAEDTHVEPTKLGIKAGERYTRRSLLEAIMVKSCNDACTALARDHSGSDAAFAADMNRTAWALGARNSYFLNSHGLPAPQYSTARDMARIAFAAYRVPVLRTFMRQPRAYFRHNSGRVTVLKATNKLLERSPAFTGMKTGYTFAAGRCLVSSGTLGGREVILVQLGSKTRNIFDDAQRVMGWSPRSTYAAGSAAYSTF